MSTLLCLILMQHSSRETIILRNLKPEVNLVHLKFLSLLTVTLKVLGSLINMLHFFVYLTRSGLQPIPIHEGYGFYLCLTACSSRAERAEIFAAYWCSTSIKTIAFYF